MKPPADVRFAFLRDPDLYDLVGRLAMRMVRDEAFAEDIRQGAYVVAMQLVLRLRPPRPGTERGWMCRVARNHGYAELRRRKQEDKPLEKDEAPDLPVEDHQKLYEEQLAIEKQFEAAEQVAANHPEQAAQLLVADGRTKAGAEAGPKDAASRKRKERARTILSSAIIAAMAVAIVFLSVRSVPRSAPGLPAGAYASLADASHELAHRSCADQKWVACLEALEQTRALDPSKLGPDEQGAWSAAVAGIRRQALADCAKGERLACIEGLDTARKYDPEGDHDPSVTLARIEAQRRLGGAEGPAPSVIPDAKLVPWRHR